MALVSLNSTEGAANLLSSSTDGLSVLPKYFVSDEERKSLHHISPLTDLTSIDLQELDGPSRAQAVEKIRKACKNDGFFEVVNHGVSDKLMDEMIKVAEEFFQMPVEDRAHLYSDDYHKRTRVSTSFNVSKEDKLHWRDYLRHPCYPMEDHIESWPNKPSSYKKIAAEYVTAIRALVLKLLEAISESLGLEKDYISNALGKQNQTMQINYYPPCPNPDLTLGLGAHTDPNCLTVVQHDDVSGLQIMKDNKWFDVPSLHGAFFVNIADQLQVISNGEYKSLVHRVVTNSTKRRISIPTFYGPSLDTIIKPASSMVALHPHGALYTAFTYGQFIDHFYSQRLVTTTLKRFEISCSEIEYKVV
ncbi:protein DMR6-LIKE OXYGENASE 1-like [Tasmannia lanceolata]|uniref:protein DMR6-LIKE OXYGENASE 1-like n=1 Tax=Tasmannia lanceolata TaxID=3420 RepID=UPI004063039E